MKSVVRALAAILGVVLLVLSVVPLFDPPPPGAVPVLLPSSFAETLFPGVPIEWVVRRLILLLAGAALVAISSPLATPGIGTSHGSEAAGGQLSPSDGHTPGFLSSHSSVRGDRLVIVAGALLLVAALAAPWMTRPLQFAFAAALMGVPAILAVVLRRRDTAIAAAALPWGAVVLAAVWLASRLWPSLGSFRVGDAIDYLGGYHCYENAIDAANLLTMTCPTGQTYLPGMLHGIGMLGWSRLTLTLVQAVSAVWTAVAVILLGSLIVRRGGHAAATVAAGVMLWSPIVMVRTLAPYPFVGTTIAAIAVFLYDHVRRRRSASAAAMLGVVLGLGTHVPAVMPLALLLALLTAIALRRAPASAIAALLFFLAAAIPGVDQHAAWVRELREHPQSWATLEALFAGRIAPFFVSGARDIVTVDARVLAIGAALAPFASARQSLGLWADTLLEPIGACLVAVGLLYSVRRLRQSHDARLLVLLYLATFLAALLGGFDRIHPTRFELAVPSALLAAAGWCALASWLTSARMRMLAACVVAAGIAVSGTILFDTINPRLLSPSIGGVALRAGSAFDHNAAWSPGMTAMSLPHMRVLAHNIAFHHVVGWNPAKVHRMLPDNEQAVAFWSAGDEMESLVSLVLCQKSSNRSLYEIRAFDGRTRLFAALRTDLKPPSADEGLEWRPLSCEQPMPTDTVVTQTALHTAAELVGEGKREEALALLRQTALDTVAQPRFYMPLAQLLAQGDAAERAEAARWAILSCKVTSGSYYEACTLAADLLRQAESTR